jgi:ribokinase
LKKVAAFLILMPTMKTPTEIVAVVPGGSNTDVIVSPTHLVGPGELSWGGGLTIGPGGKSRNVAQMMAAYLGLGRVAFLGRTLAAPKGLGDLERRLSEAAGAGGSAKVEDLLPTVYCLLAQVPMAALEEAGVVTEHVLRTAYEGTAAGTALIPVDVSGENTIYVAPGLNDHFSPQDVAAAEPLVAEVAEQSVRRGERGVMALALEIRLETAVAAAKLARQHGMLVVLDMGGMQAGADYSPLLSLADVVKPNEHEARMLSGVEVHDTATASRAAKVLRERYGIGRLVITAGSGGSYVIENDGEARHHAAHILGAAVDTTGCGDQFMAVLCAELALGGDLAAAIEPASRAAGMQAMRSGIQPVRRAELASG